MTNAYHKHPGKPGRVAETFKRPKIRSYRKGNAREETIANTMSRNKASWSSHMARLTQQERHTLILAAVESYR